MRTSPPYLTRDQLSGLAEGYYWIKRNEPCAAQYWEIARFDGTVWWITGSTMDHLPTRNIDASNAWQLGPRLEPPK